MFTPARKECTNVTVTSSHCIQWLFNRCNTADMNTIFIQCYASFFTKCGNNCMWAFLTQFLHLLIQLFSSFLSRKEDQITIWNYLL